MNILNYPCNPANYGGKRTAPVRYIVVHYTAGHNDTAENNGVYFGREHVGASAHYFVDPEVIVQSVPDDRVAWHCGGWPYYHPECRNGNSIGVEICTRYENGNYFFDPAAVSHAAELVKHLMTVYNVPVENVVRHYDVTRKNCPAPMCGKNEGAWEEFKEMIGMRFQKIEDLPEWGVATVEKLVGNGVLQGNSADGLDLSMDMLRLLVVLDRSGVFDRKEN